MAQNRTKSEGFMLRFPDGMRDRIKAAAEASGRSMNAEIIERLEQSFEFPRRESQHTRELAEAYQTTAELERGIEELKEELQRKEKYIINSLAEIRQLNTEKLEFDKRLAAKQSEIDGLRGELSEVRAILSTYTEYTDGLRRIEELIRSLAEDVRSVRKSDE